MNIPERDNNDVDLDKEFEIISGIQANPFLKKDVLIDSGPEIPPWTEWSDLLINQEDWNSPKILDSTIVSNESNNDLDSIDKVESFHDPMGHCKLPYNIPVDRYLRVRWQQISMVWSPPDYRNCPTDLISPNYHLLQYPEMKAIITAIMNLEMLAESVGFAIEYTSDQFVPNTTGPWRPWHHVYSRSKAGRNSKHRIVINPNGKYIVRLFYLGSWRRIYVDDFMPVDVNGRHLLPISVYPELWPVLLSKALLKISALYSKQQFGLRFLKPNPMDPIIHLTGWCSDTFLLKDIPIPNIWMLIEKLMCKNHQINELEGDNLNYIYSRVKMLSQKIDFAIEESMTDPIYENFGSVAIIAEIDGLETLKKIDEQLPTSNGSMYSNIDYGLRVSELYHSLKNAQYNSHGIFNPINEEEGEFGDLRPCIPHNIMICQATTECINQDKENMPRWKMFRWVDWAKRNGLYEEKQYVYSMHIFSPFKKKQIPIKIPKSPYNKLWELDSKITYLVKPLNKKDKPADEIEMRPTEEPHWIRMEQILPISRILHVYFRPSNFNNICKINREYPNGILQNEMNKHTKVERKRSHSENSLYQPKFKECFRFYLYCDLPVSKKVIIQLAVLSDNVIKNEIYDSSKNCNLSSKEVSTDSLSNLELEKSIFYLILNTFDWTNRGQLGRPIHSLRCTSIGTRFFTLAEGQVALEIIYNVPNNYEILILSQAPIRIYNYNEVMEQTLKLTRSLDLFTSTLKSILISLKNLQIGSKEYVNKLSDFFEALLPEHIPKPGRDPRYPKRVSREIFFEFQKVIIEELLNENAGKKIEEKASIIENICFIFNNEDFGINYLEEYHRTLFNLVKQRFLERIEEEIITEPNKKSSTSNITRKSRNLEKKIKLNWLTDKIILHPKRDILWLLKKMFYDKPNLLYLYSFRSELNRKNLMNEYRGIYRNLVYSVEFYVLFRFFVNTFAEEPTYTSIDLYCENIEGWVLHIINNDTKEELTHSHPYRVGRNFIKNNSGYTIYGYAYHAKELPKEIPWRLRFWYHEDAIPLHPCSMNNLGECVYNPKAFPTNLVSQMIQGHYIPNRKTSICMAILKISEPQWITLQLYLTRPKVKFFVRICPLEYPDKEIFFIGAQGAVVISHLWLNPNDLKEEHEENQFDDIIDDSASNKNCVEYLIECFTRPFLWTLTENEANLVSQVEAKQLESMRIFDESTIDVDKLNLKANLGYQHRSLVLSLSYQQNELLNQILMHPPKWILQIIVDQSKSNGVILEEDRRRQEAFKLVKMIWEEDDPNRYKKGFMLRHEFNRIQREIDKMNSNNLSYILNLFDRYHRFLTMDLSDEPWPPKDWPYVSKKLEFVKKTQPDIQETVNNFVNNLKTTVNDETEIEHIEEKRNKIIENLYNYLENSKERVFRIDNHLKKFHNESRQNMSNFIMAGRDKIFNKRNKPNKKKN